MPTGERDIILFAGGSDGYGDAVSRGRDSYHWAANWDMRSGRAIPAQIPIRVGVAAGRDYHNPITFAFEWEDSNGVPLVLFGTGNGSASARVFSLKDSTTASDNAQAIDPYTSGVLFRHDGSAADTEMAYFCNGTANDVLVQRNKAGTYATAGHDAKADLLAVIGSDLYRVTSDYLVSKLTLNSDPGLDASYQTDIPVGRPTYPINAMVDLGGTPIVCKGDGIFKYNPAPSVAEFINILPFRTPHPDHGKGSFTDGRGRVYVPTADGHIIVVTFGYQNSQTPTRLANIDRDTPWGVITAITADLDHVYAATEPGQLRHQQLGLRVLSDDGGVFTEHTSDVTDRSLTTNADWTLLAATAPDRIYLGTTEPVLGHYFDLYSERTSAVGGTGAGFAVAYSDGASGWVDISLGSGGQGTLDSTMRFSRSVAIVYKDSTGTDLLAASTPWATDTVNSISGLYWIRITPPTSTTLTGVKVREIHSIPYRPPFNRDVAPISAYIKGGALPHILVGTWRGEELIWHDQWVLDSPRVEQLIISRAGWASTTGQRTLFAITGQSVHGVSIGADAHPARTPFPMLGTSGQIDTHLLAWSGHDFDKPNHIKRGVRIILDFPNVQEDDEVYVYTWWDEDYEEAHVLEPDNASKMVLDVPGEGRILYGVVQYENTTRNEWAPVLNSVIAPVWEWDEEHMPQARSPQESPPRR